MAPAAALLLLRRRGLFPKLHIRRIMDQYALDCFEALGLKEIPHKTAALYLRVKSARDKLAPGRLDADTFALIYALTVPDKASPPVPPAPPSQE